MKLFKRKKIENSQDPIDYLNRKKDHRLFVFSSSWSNRKRMSPKVRKGFKIAGIVGLPLLAIALGTGIGIYSSKQNNNTLVNNVVVNAEVTKRRIYLISEDNYSVPLTVSLDKKATIYEEMLELIDLLKVSSDASTEFLRGFIPDETKVNSFINEENTLIVDFSAEFLNYTEQEETRMVESLVSTLSQFDGVENVKITVDGEELVRMPKKNTLVNQSINNINPLFTTPSLIENKELVTVFYQRDYSSSESYMIPVSLYADKGESDNITFVNGLFKQLPSRYCLENLSLYNNISQNQIVNDKFSLTVNSNALIDENTVNKELYELVMLSLDLMGKEELVSFDIEGQALAVEGIYDEEDQVVSSIYYNEIEI